MHLKRPKDFALKRKKLVPLSIAYFPEKVL